MHFINHKKLPIGRFWISISKEDPSVTNESLNHFNPFFHELEFSSLTNIKYHFLRKIFQCIEERTSLLYPKRKCQ